MRKEKIWLSAPHPSGRELKYIELAIERGQIVPNGINVDELENEIAAFQGEGFISCLSSGTAGIHLGLVMLDVGAGDEVLCSSFTFAATANPIVYQGATPVYVDSEDVTWNMSPARLEEAITDRMKKGKKPKAIIVVHLFGMPAQMDEIMDVARRYEIQVIEDAAEAMGSTFGGRKCGTLADVGVLSFNGNKIITTSGGGALWSKNKEVTDFAKFLSTQARDPFPHYEHSHIGYNYRMSNICAGIGRGQMEVLDTYIAKRRENHFFYSEAFKDLEGITLLEEPDERFYSNFWLTTILVDPEKTGGVTREDIRIKFEELGIETRPLWKPMHLQPVFRDCPAYMDGTSERLFDMGLCLPSSSNISDEDRQFVADSLINTIQKS